jgi:hypothetical protein
MNWHNLGPQIIEIWKKCLTHYTQNIACIGLKKKIKGEEEGFNTEYTKNCPQGNYVPEYVCWDSLIVQRIP